MNFILGLIALAVAAYLMLLIIDLLWKCYLLIAGFVVGCWNIFYGIFRFIRSAICFGYDVYIYFRQARAIIMAAAGKTQPTVADAIANRNCGRALSASVGAVKSRTKSCSFETELPPFGQKVPSRPQSREQSCGRKIQTFGRSLCLF